LGFTGPGWSQGSTVSKLPEDSSENKVGKQLSGKNAASRILINSCILTHVIFQITEGPCFTDEETKAQKGEATELKSQSKKEAESGIRTDLFTVLFSHQRRKDER
jgi:hypothetical protein